MIILRINPNTLGPIKDNIAISEKASAVNNTYMIRNRTETLYDNHRGIEIIGIRSTIGNGCPRTDAVTTH